MKYLDEVKRAMTYLGSQEQTLFIGQSIRYPGTPIHGTLESVPDDKKIEMPVFEESQLGLSIGLALEGYVPVSIFPRFNFLLVAMSQLVNHVDKIPYISQGGLMPKVIIKTMVGSVRPLDAGVQHGGDFAEGLKHMLDTVAIERLTEADMIVPAYERALTREDGKSTILIEYGDFYNEK